MTDTVLLIHAGVVDSHAWAPQLAALRGYRVAAPDLPGFGDAPPPDGEFSHVEDVAALLDGPAAVVGGSLGGRIALELALERPELVERLLLAPPGLRRHFHPWSDELRRFGEREDELLEAGDVDGAVELNLERWALPHVHDVVRPMQRRAFELQLATPGARERPGPELRLETITAPTVVAVGERDVRDFHEIAARLVREIPAARLVTIPGAGHLPGLEAPEAFNALLREFLAA